MHVFLYVEEASQYGSSSPCDPKGKIPQTPETCNRVPNFWRLIRDWSPGQKKIKIQGRFQKTKQPTKNMVVVATESKRKVMGSIYVAVFTETRVWQRVAP